MSVVIGTAGHIDHGKTTLLRALTGIDADRLPEERARGMTIDVGFAHLTLSSGHTLDFVDVPGHDRLVGNMLVGAGEIDAAMLVVAADDGPRAQTIEHLALLDALGIRDGLAVVTKIDTVEPARVETVVAEVRERLARTSLAGAPVVAVSSVDGRGLEELLAALETLAARVEAEHETGRHGPATSAVRLGVDRVFAVKGRGVVVTGTLRSGSLARGTTLRVVPGDASARIREIQVHGSPVETTGPGRTALNLAGVDAVDLHRGLVLTDDAAIRDSDRLLVRLARPLPDRTRARFHLGTAAAEATIGRSGRDAIDLPDGSATAIVRLDAAIGVAPGDRFVLRRATGTERIVGGVVLDVVPARGVSRRRQTPERVAALAQAIATAPRHATPSMEGALLDLHGALIAVDGSVRLAPDVVAAAQVAVTGAVDAAGGRLALTTGRSAAVHAIRRAATLDRDHAATAAASELDRLVAAGTLVRDGSTVAAPDTAAPPGPAADPRLAAAMDRLEAALAVNAPPSLHEAAAATGCPPEGIRALERANRIVVLEPDLAYAWTTYTSLAGQALALAGAAPLTPAALRDATRTSRKYVMAILADLDRRGILRRTADGHVPGPRAPELAPAPATTTPR